MIIIAGASGKIGEYLVKHLCDDYEIIGTYNKNMPKYINKSVHYYPLDVCNANSVDNFVNKIKNKTERMVLINVFGITKDGMGHKMDEAVWDNVVDTNLKGIFLMCRAFLPIMRQHLWGRIINISSIVGQLGVPGTVAYSSSKAGVFGLTRTVASENAKKNITVNSLALGYFNIGIINTIAPEVQQQIKEKIPMGRFGDPKNIELAVRYLIDSDYITGTTIDINGGLL